MLKLLVSLDGKNYVYPKVQLNKVSNDYSTDEKISIFANPKEAKPTKQIMTTPNMVINLIMSTNIFLKIFMSGPRNLVESKSVTNQIHCTKIKMQSTMFISTLGSKT